jgi:hypothetical protein
MVRAKLMDWRLLKMKKRYLIPNAIRPFWFGFLLLVSAGISSAPLANRTELINAVASAKKIILFSLEPGDSGQRDPDTGACLGHCYFGWPVLGQVKISPRSKLLGQMSAWVKTPEPNEQALCFDPRHGLRIITEESTIDFVVCFECEGIEVYVDSKLIALSPKPSNVQRDWDRILKKAGVKLSQTDSE